jgi:phage FluMu gp28-like protein
VQWASYQLAWLADQSPRKTAVKSRRIGFSEVVAYEAAERAIGVDLMHSNRRFKPVNQNLISASHRQSKELLSKVLHHLKQFQDRGMCTIVGESKTELKIAVGGYTSLVMAFSSNPRSIRGYAGDVILDEFGNTRNQDAVWKAALPLALANLGHKTGYKVRVIGTPEGDDNKFYEINRGKPSKFWSCHTVDIYEAERCNFPIMVDCEDGEQRPGTAAEMRLAYDEDTFAQEFECSFLAANTRYISAELYDACIYEDDPSSPEDVELPDTVGLAYGGLDIADVTGTGDLWAWVELQRRTTPATRKSPASTALWHMDTDAWCARPAKDGEERDQAKAWEDMEAWADKRVRHCSRAAVDATGIGVQFSARLEQRHRGRVQRVNFSSSTQREEVVSSLRLGMERKNVRLRASDRALRTDVLMLRRKVKNGQVRVQAPRTARGHADRAWALAMAVAVSGDSVVGGAAPVAPLPVQKQPVRRSLWGNAPRPKGPWGEDGRGR